jgi:hypothetical protein
MYPYVALCGPTYLENSHASHTWHWPSRESTCFKGSEAPPVWVIADGRTQPEGDGAAHRQGYFGKITGRVTSEVNRQRALWPQNGTITVS